MDATELVDDDASLSDIDRDWYEELYDLVYMSAEDPVDAQSQSDGIRGAASLREEIRALRLDSFTERLPNER